MASETKAGTSRRKTSTETKTTTAKTVKKAPSKAAAPAKAVTKVAASKTTPTKTKETKLPVKKAAAPRKRKSTGQPITTAARLQHIEIAAYYIAEKSGFSRDPADCWAAAEAEVDTLLLAGKLSE